MNVSCFFFTKRSLYAIAFTMQLFYKKKSLHDIVDHATFLQRRRLYKILFTQNIFTQKATTFFAESIMPSSFNISAVKDLSRFCKKKGEKCFCGQYISERKKKTFLKLMLFRQVKGLFIAI